MAGTKLRPLTWGDTMDRDQDRSKDVGRIIAAAYEAHANQLQRHLTAYTRDATAAEDLMQEAFVRLTCEVRAGRTPDAMGPWLFRVGRNLAASRGRKLSVADRRRRELVSHDIGDSPETIAIDAEDQRSACAALAALAEADRQALLMAAHGYRGIEIANAIGLSEAATRTRLSRARAHLRIRLTAVEAG